MERTYPLVPISSVGVVVWNGLEVLLVRRRNPPLAGYWSIPGGRQELGESVFEAAAREVLEETGLKVEPVRVITVVDHVEKDTGGQVTSHHTIIEVAATSRGGSPVPGDDVTEARWASLPDMEALVVLDDVKRVVRQALAQRL